MAKSFPIPDNLCGINGCTFLKLHEGAHTWEQQ